MQQKSVIYAQTHCGKNAYWLNKVILTSHLSNTKQYTNLRVQPKKKIGAQKT